MSRRSEYSKSVVLDRELLVFVSVCFVSTTTVILILKMNQPGMNSLPHTVGGAALSFSSQNIVWPQPFYEQSRSRPARAGTDCRSFKTVHTIGERFRTRVPVSY